MVNNEQITTPSGMGGLQRFDEQTGSRAQIKPEWLLAIIIMVVIGMAGLKLAFPLV